jgi:uncharacterized protein YndB with AHSA1/START domain
MTEPQTAEDTRDIVVEEVLPHHPSVVWKALTTSSLIARWLMPNDFSLAVGQPFNFRSPPMGDWNGIVDCVVLEVEPERRLAYSWKGAAGTPGELDTVVTWTLALVEGGTRLRMVHAGFRLPRNAMAFEMMSPGWGRIMQAIGRVVAEEAQSGAA